MLSEKNFKSYEKKIKLCKKNFKLCERKIFIRMLCKKKLSESFK